ncbi:2,3-bisphosphoglycerate-dependent phosphoglycerate mutase [Streptomyces acidiscabies]|nr:2,3-bisphosphoglycerate-dependent phosphoglycerate mutase [Streptomyces acidiscabies]
MSARGGEEVPRAYAGAERAVVVGDAFVPAGTGPLRRLVVLRHAKSAWPDGVPDHDRPLGPRGLRDAPAAGRALAEADCLPDLALCSTAERAHRTWDLASREWATPPPVRHDPRLYGADVPELLDVLRETPPEVETLLLVGHNPGLEDLVLDLAGDGVDDTLERVAVKFPTSAIAVLAWHATTWRTLARGTALLTSVTVPRGKKP